MTSIIETSLYVSVTALLILLFKRLFKNRLSAKWHVYIWMLLAIRFILPSLPESEFSIFNAIDVPEITTQEQTAEQETTTYPDIKNINVSPVTPNIAPITERLPSVDANITDNIISDIDSKTEDVAVPAHDIEYIEADLPEETLFTLGGIVSFVKEVGTVILLGYFVIVYLICLRKTTSHDRVTDTQSITLLDNCKQKVRVKRRVSLVRFGANPMLMGLIKPVIVLPDGYSDDENKDILIHELCHLKHGDVYLIWLAMLVLCANWYNPIMWVSFFIFRRDIEVYCDERVLKHTDSKKDYAALLVKTALRKNKFIAGTTSLQNGKKEVERRVKYMAYFKKPKVLTAIVIVGVALVISVGCLTNPVGNVQEDNTAQIYASFINGTETVVIRGENYNLTELVDSVGTVNQPVYYYFHDMNGDGVDELHLKTSMSYFIFTIKDEKMSLWYRGTIYENPTEDGNIIYIRHGGAPTNQTVIYISLDENGNEVFRDTVAKYDENEDGTFETFFRDSKKISELEYSEISGKYLSRNIIYLAKWTEIKPQQGSDVSKETTDDYSEVYDNDGKVMESSKNFLLEDRTDAYFFEVYGNDGDVLHSDSSDKCPVFIHLDGPLYELRMPQGTSFRDSYFFNVETGYKSEKYGRPFYITNGVIAYLYNLPTFESVYPSKTGELAVIELFDLYDRVLVDTIDAEFLKESTSHLIEYVDDTHISVTYYTDGGQKENKEIFETVSLSGITLAEEQDIKAVKNEKETVLPQPDKKAVENAKNQENTVEVTEQKTSEVLYDEELLHELFFSQENSGESADTESSVASQPMENETADTTVEGIIPVVDNTPVEDTTVENTVVEDTTAEETIVGNEEEISTEAEANADELWTETETSDIETEDNKAFDDNEIFINGSDVFIEQ